MFAYPDINTRGVGKFLNSYANPRLRLVFAWLYRILPTPLVFISGYANADNVFYCLNIILLPCYDIFYLIIACDGTFSIFISFYSVTWHFLPKGWLFLCYSTQLSFHFAPKSSKLHLKIDQSVKPYDKGLIWELRARSGLRFLNSCEGKTSTTNQWWDSTGSLVDLDQ